MPAPQQELRLEDLQLKSLQISGLPALRQLSMAADLNDGGSTGCIDVIQLEDLPKLRVRLAFVVTVPHLPGLGSRPPPSRPIYGFLIDHGMPGVTLHSTQFPTFMAGSQHIHLPGGDLDHVPAAPGGLCQQAALCWAIMLFGVLALGAKRTPHDSVSSCLRRPALCAALQITVRNKTWELPGLCSLSGGSSAVTVVYVAGRRREERRQKGLPGPAGQA